ncbi:MAG: lysophospholipid acyltransferase family protein [Phycisphaerales bacterium]
MNRLPLRERRPGAPLARILWFESIRILTRAIFRVVYRPIVIDAHRVPTKGPLLIAANHQSYLDPPLVGDYPARQCAFVARAGLFKVPIFAPLIRSLDATPIKESGNDRGAIMTVLELLKNGQAVVIFPEGSRSTDGAMHQFKRGLALLVKMGKVPVVPAALEGCYDCFPPGGRPRFFWRGPRVALQFGDPISYEEFMKDGPDAGLQHVEREVDRMRLNLRSLLRARNSDHFPANTAGDGAVTPDAPTARPEAAAEPLPEKRSASPSAGESRTGS